MALHCPLAVVAVLLLPLVAASAATDFDFFHHVQQLLGCTVARLLLQHKHKCHLLLPGRQEAGGGLRHPRPLARVRRVPPRRREPQQDQLLAGLLQRHRSSRPVTDQGPGQRHAPELGDAVVQEQGKHAVLEPRVEPARHLLQHGPAYSYFLAALELKARFNLTRILLDAGVVPSDDKEYCLRSIRDAVAAATGSAPMLECNRNGRNETQLYQVFQCVGLEALDGRTLVHCPPPEHRGCTDMVKFPPF